MKWVDRVAPRRGDTQRYSWGQWQADAALFDGHRYPLHGLTTTYSANPAEPVAAEFPAYVTALLASDGPVWSVERLRVAVFSEARFQWQQLRSGRPGDLFGSPGLGVLEAPWPGGVTGDLLAKALLHADLAGNAYIVRDGDTVTCLRPDYCELVLAPRMVPRGPGGEPVQVGWAKAGLFYYEGGPALNAAPAVYLPDEFAHFAPHPDPLAPFRGMSWLTPVVREIQADKQMTLHKSKFLTNAATPNLSVSLKEGVTPKQFEAFVSEMERQHRGVDNAYKTLYTANGADVTVIGANMRQLDFKSVAGAGETRIANAAGVHPAVVGMSEGMQGSSLNAGNYGAAKRATVDGTIRPLWRNFAGSVQTIVPPPPGARLWIDDRDIPYLRDDAHDLAEIRESEARTIRQLVDAGYTPETVVAAVTTGDWGRLRHSGLFSVQLQTPGAGVGEGDV